MSEQYLSTTQSTKGATKPIAAYSIADLTNQIGDLAIYADTITRRFDTVIERLFGPSPEMPQGKVIDLPRAAPPFGGDLGEAFYALERLRNSIECVDRLSNRVDNL